MPLSLFFSLFVSFVSVYIPLSPSLSLSLCPPSLSCLWLSHSPTHVSQELSLPLPLFLVVQPIEWQAYFRGLFSNQDVQVSLSEEEPIVNRSPQYLTRLIDLLRLTPNR